MPGDVSNSVVRKEGRLLEIRTLGDQVGMKHCAHAPDPEARDKTTTDANSG